MKILQFLAVITLGAGLMACEKQHLKPWAGGCEDLKTLKTDSALVTVRNNICGDDYWGGLVFEIDQTKEIIRAVEFVRSHAINAVPQPQPERKYMMVFQEVKEYHSNRISCRAIGPYNISKSRKVIVQSLTEINPK